MNQKFDDMRNSGMSLDAEDEMFTPDPDPHQWNSDLTPSAKTALVLANVTEQILKCEHWADRLPVDGDDEHDSRTVQCTDFVNATSQDVAAKKISSFFLYDSMTHTGGEDDCLLHQTDKISKFMVGDLRKSKNKVEVDPLSPGGRELVAVVRDISKHFSYGGDRFRDFAKCCEFENRPQLIPEPALNGTRMSASTSQIGKIVLLQAPAIMYMQKYVDEKSLKNVATHFADPLFWASLSELEGLCIAIAKTLTVAQCEEAYTGAFKVSRLLMSCTTTDLRCCTGIVQLL